MTKRLTFRAATIGLALTSLLAVTACGGDDDSSDTTERTATTAAPSGSDTTTPAGTATTAGGSDTSTGGSTAEECTAMAEDFAKALGAGANPTADPAQIEDAFNRLEANVPADLKDDVELVGDALGKYADLYEKVKDDPTKAATDPDILEALQELSAPEYQSATQAISAYFTSACQTGG